MTQFGATAALARVRRTAALVLAVGVGAGGQAGATPPSDVVAAKTAPAALPTAAAPLLQGIASRKVHGSAGTFDLPLNPSPAALQLLPAVQDFGSVPAGNTGSPIPFIATNLGGVATGPLSVALSGLDAMQYVIATDGCTAQVLGAGQSCQVTISFHPGSTGIKQATLGVAATPGGSATSSLIGTGQ